jgi:uncharacterized membrane protein YkvA (DUF1232 family)
MSNDREVRGQTMVRQLLLIRGVARLVFALLRDRRVPLAAKLVVAAAVVYFVSPIDFVPDIIPGLGQLDDLIIVLVAVAVFLAWVPRQILLEHLRGGGHGRSGDGRSDANVIEGTYRVDDDPPPN